MEPKVTDLGGDEATLTISEPVGDDGNLEPAILTTESILSQLPPMTGKGTVTKKIKVVVENVNMPPEIVGVSACC